MDDDEYIRKPDKAYSERLIDDDFNSYSSGSSSSSSLLSIDEELAILRSLNKTEGDERVKMKKILKDAKIMESIEKSVIYENDKKTSGCQKVDNQFPDENELEQILRMSEEEYYEEQMLILEEMEREEKTKKLKMMEFKKAELSNVIIKMSKIVKFNNKKNDDSIILDILNDYLEHGIEKLFLDVHEFEIFNNYLKINYEDLNFLNRKTFLNTREYEFLKNRITIK